MKKYQKNENLVKNENFKKTPCKKPINKQFSKK